MKKRTAYEWFVIAVSLVFLLCCAGWLLFQYTHPADWQVRTQRQERPAALQPSSASNTDGLLPGEIINLNTASRSDLLRLPDIGSTRAVAILTHRDTHGPFTCVEDLLAVDGIGPVTLEQLRPYICVE